MVSYERYRKQLKAMQEQLNATTGEKDTPVLIIDDEAYVAIKPQLDAPTTDRSGRRIITFADGVRSVINRKTVIIIDDIA